MDRTVLLKQYNDKIKCSNPPTKKQYVNEQSLWIKVIVFWNRSDNKCWCVMREVNKVAYEDEK